MTTLAYVALGSNLGDRHAHVEGARAELAAVEGVRVLRASPLIETSAVGGPPDAPDFLNGVLEIETELGPRQLLAELVRIEDAHGRVRVEGERDAPRTLDLDLLLYGRERWNTPELELPHPRMEERLFVLEPLARLEPEFVLFSGLLVRERLAQLRAQDQVPSAPSQ